MSIFDEAALMFDTTSKGIVPTGVVDAVKQERADAEAEELARIERAVRLCPGLNAALYHRRLNPDYPTLGAETTARRLRELADRGAVHEADGAWRPGPKPTDPIEESPVGNARDTDGEAAVLQYVTEHPGCTTSDVTNAVGKGLNRPARSTWTRRRLIRLAEAGDLRQERAGRTENGGKAGEPDRWWPAAETAAERSGEDLEERARRVLGDLGDGSPVGDLSAALDEVVALRGKLAVAEANLTEARRQSEGTVDADHAVLRTKLWSLFGGPRSPFDDDTIVELVREVVAERDALRVAGEDLVGQVAQARADAAHGRESLDTLNACLEDLARELGVEVTDESDDFALALAAIRSMKAKTAYLDRQLAEAEERARRAEAGAADLSALTLALLVCEQELDEFAQPDLTREVLLGGARLGGCVLSRLVTARREAVLAGAEYAARAIRGPEWSIPDEPWEERQDAITHLRSAVRLLSYAVVTAAAAGVLADPAAEAVAS